MTGSDARTDPRVGLVRVIGVASVTLAAAGLVAPRALAATAGVRDVSAPTLPLLVRLAAARQASLGLALLTRADLDAHRAAGLFLPTTVADAAAVLVAHRRGVLARRAAVASLVVLGTDVWVLVRSRR